jgi:hypothetical protein
MLIWLVVPRSMTLRQTKLCQEFGGARVLKRGTGGEDFARRGQVLHAVHGLPEIVLPLVKAYGDARPFLDTDL